MSSTIGQRFSGNQFAGVRVAAGGSSSTSSSQNAVVDASRSRLVEENAGTATIAPPRLIAPMAPARLNVPAPTPNHAPDPIPATIPAPTPLGMTGTDTILTRLARGEIIQFEGITIPSGIAILDGGGSSLNLPSVAPIAPTPQQQTSQAVPAVNLGGLPQNVLDHINSLRAQARDWQQTAARNNRARIIAVNEEIENDIQLKKEKAGNWVLTQILEQRDAEIERLGREAGVLTRDLAASEVRRRAVTRVMQQVRDEEEDRKLYSSTYWTQKY